MLFRTKKENEEMKASSECTSCPVLTRCRTLAEHHMSLADYDKQLPKLLTEEETARILTQAEELIQWTDAVKDYALKCALTGVRYPGWKVVKKNTKRRFTDETAVAERVIKEGLDPFEKKLLSVSAMEKQLGKEKFDKLLLDLTEKPEGKMELAPVTDTRAEVLIGGEE